MRKLICIVLVLNISSCALLQKKKEEKKVDLSTNKNKYSYAIGLSIGENIQKGKFEVNTELLKLGVEDVLAGNGLKMSSQERKLAMQMLQQEISNKRNQEAAKNKLDGEKFLTENKKNKDIVVTGSGLQYKILGEGKGKTALAGDKVKVHYMGKTIDGNEFDSSYKRGKALEIQVNKVIKGWQEVLQIMKPGSKYKVFIPSDLAYGARGSYKIPPNSVLIFEIELLEILNKKNAKENLKTNKEEKKAVKK